MASGAFAHLATCRTGGAKTLVHQRPTPRTFRGRSRHHQTPGGTARWAALQSELGRLKCPGISRARMQRLHDQYAVSGAWPQRQGSRAARQPRQASTGAGSGAVRWPGPAVANRRVRRWVRRSGKRGAPFKREQNPRGSATPSTPILWPTSNWDGRHPGSRMISSEPSALVLSRLPWLHQC